VGTADRIEVLHVDDEPDITEITQLKLEGEGPYSVTAETDPEAALVRLQNGAFDCIVSDYDMPGMDGLDLLRAVRECNDDIPFILFTGKGSEQIASQAISAGVTDYLQKGAGSDTYTLLANRIKNAVTQRRAEQELRAQERLSERIVQASPVAIVVHDADGDVILANERASEILGAIEDELHARAYEDSSWALYDDDGEYLAFDELPFSRVIAGEEIRNERLTVETGDGDRREIVAYGAPLRDEGGTIEGTVIPFEERS
jgi:PAS domain S-box-containing protein